MKDTTDQLSNRLGKGMIYGAWILLLVILTLAFNRLLENQRNPNQTVNTRISVQGIPEVVLQRNRFGHYLARGFIDNHQVTFLLDTGATLVSVPDSLARRLNLARGVPYSAHTANGTITVYSTVLGSVKLGSIELRQIPATINPHMEEDEILLGMSFMKHLEIIQRGEQLTLRLPTTSTL